MAKTEYQKREWGLRYNEKTDLTQEMQRNGWQGF